MTVRSEIATAVTVFVIVPTFTVNAAAAGSGALASAWSNAIFSAAPLTAIELTTGAVSVLFTSEEAKLATALPSAAWMPSVAVAGAV